MHFSGGSSSGKRVDLGGKSSKQRDSRKLIEEARVERKRRQDSKQRAAAALQIQKCFRGRKAIAEAHAEVRAKFIREFGDSCQKVDRHCFSPRSDFLPRLLFFFNPNSVGDVNILVKTCQILHHFATPSGDFVSVISGKDFAAELSIISLRVKRLAFACILAIHHNREKFKDQLLLFCDSAETPSVVLLETAGGLIEPKAPWSCKVVGFLSQRNAFGLLRDIIILLILKTEVPRYSKLQASSLERFLIKVTSLASLPSCDCATLDPRWTFPLQILSLPLVWQVLPEFKKVFATQGLFGHHVQQMSMFLPLPMSSLPTDTTKEYPSYACILGNLLEVAEMAISQPNFTVEMALDFATVVTFWLEALPPFLAPSSREADDDGDLDMEERTKEISLGEDLKDQISNSMLSGLLKQLVNILLKEIRNLYELHSVRNSSFEAAATGAICGLLHVIFSTFQLERIVTVLAYNTELVPVLWSFMKRCHDSQNWPTFPGFKSTISDAPGWLLPLSVFCPVYRHMLMIIDNEEFYEKQKPLSLADVRSLVIILKEALWHLLWIMPSKSSVKTLTSQKSLENLSSHGCLSVDFICHRASLGAAELLTQLEDWNNRRQFASADEFNSSEAVSEVFLSQAITENTRANAILRQAPFLVPFTCRVRIYMSQLGEIRNSDRLHAVTSPHRFRIRRDRIVEDAFGLISQLTEQDLKGMMRIAFVNELGVEEAGIDGGGIFKDFMESITKTAFDVQYGLFKETSDHMLYPNPASGMIHEQHLQYFRFLGIILGKAMFEGILVDIPFATFFLSKLKQKHNYLNDLPSLDPELYRHLLFLKRYEGDISELSLNFVIVNNEYGEQTEEELLPGGKDIQVTNDNVIMFIHLIANHRLNTQIRKQSKNFLQGVQQLIQPKWMAMFNEHELQLLISGSLDGMDVNDLCSNANYSGGYHEKHLVIEMFWETVRNFSAQQQKKFLKFVTGCSRGPLLGFKYLEPPFCIQRVVPDDALDRLPTSATCMNLLKLPPYTTKEKMEMKLVYAINAEAGFDLS